MAVYEIKEITVDGIYVGIVRSDRKTAAIEVTGECRVIFRVPLNFPENEVYTFVRNKRKWIEKALLHQKNRIPEEVFLSEAEELKRKAKEIIPKKVSYYSSLMGLKPTAVKINTAKTRFGSCSSKNSLNFSARLMKYPEEAVDYVIVHELAHIKYHNHSKSFYDLIEKYMPDYKERIKMLKR